MNIYSIISLVACILSLILGITVFSLAPRRLIGRAFIIGILFLLVIEFSLFMIFLQKDRVIFWGRTAIGSCCFLLPTWAVISLVYGRNDYRELLKRRIWYLSLLYGVGMVFFILLWKVDFVKVPATFPGEIIQINTTGKYFLIFALLSAVIILINFENTLRLTKISSRKGKRLPLYVLTGTFLFWIYTISQMLLYSRISNHLTLAGLIVIIVTNIVLIFYSIRHGLMQLEVNLGREVIYSSAIIFIVGVYLFVIGIAGKIVQLAGGSINLFLSFLAAFFAFFFLLAMLVSRSLKERIKTFIDRNFYKNHYDYREQWGKFSESLSAVLNFDELLTTIIENITNIFSAKKTIIFLLDDFTGNLIIRKSKNMNQIPDIKFNQNSSFIDWFHRLGEAVEISTIINQSQQIGLLDNEIENFKKLDASGVCVPMIAQQKFMGILVLGNKEQNDPYNKEDFDLLETLANQSSIAILNAKLSEDLLISHELASFHKVSSFVLHDLRNSVSMLSMMIQNAEIRWENQGFQQDMLQTISNAVTKMKSLMSKISSLPEKLEPKRQKVQVTDLINQVIREAKIESLKHIQYLKDLKPLPLVTIDPEEIQKVIENLVINAVEAMPKGGTLKIATNEIENNNNYFLRNGINSFDQNFIEIIISDDGVGMTEEFIRDRLFKPFQTTKKKGLGIGLYHCKEIISAHGGTIEFESQLNQGTRCKIRIPISNHNNFAQQANPIMSKTELVLN